MAKRQKPKVVQCVDCKTERKFGAKAYAAKIEKAGGETSFIRSFRCRECGKIHRQKMMDAVKKLKGEKKPKISPTMQKYLDGKLWFQQPDYVFPAPRSSR